MKTLLTNFVWQAVSLRGNEQVLSNGRWVGVLTMPNFDANKEYRWRKRPRK